MSKENFRLAFGAILAVTIPVISSGNAGCMEKARSLFENRHYKKALETVEKCGDSSPTLKLRGLVFHRLYRADSAHHYLKAAYTAGERGDDLLVAYAEALIWKGEFDSAGPVLDSVESKQHPDYRYAEAARHELNGRLAEAMAIYDQILADDGNAYYALYKRAELLSWDKKTAESLDLYNRIADSKNAPVEIRHAAMVKRAQLRAWNKEYRAAEAQLRLVLKRDPGNIAARLVQAEINEWRGEYAKARDLYTQVLSIMPENRQAREKLEELKWTK